MRLRRGLLVQALAACLVLQVASAGAETPARPALAAKTGAEAERTGKRGEAVTIDAAVRGGASVRISDGAAFVAEDRAGLAAGASVLVAPWRRFALGVAFDHVELGRERSELDAAGAIEVSRRADTLWLPLRLYVARDDTFGLHVRIAPGLTWQSADAVGTLYTGTFVSNPVSFSCSGSEAANLALSAGLGGEAAIGGGLVVDADLGFDNHHFSSEVLDGCVPGAGTTAAFSVRLGLAYRFEL